MIDISSITSNIANSVKSTGQKAIRMATSPTAFSWYGVAGVIVTGVVTFLATCKWQEKKNERFDKIFNDDPDDLNENDRDPKERVKEIAETALIFTPPVLVAAGTCYCILHGNSKALETVGKLTEANNFLSNKFSRASSAAAGMAVGEVKSQLERDPNPNTCLDCNLFSGDPAEIDDHGKVVTFYDTFTERWFESTIFDVLRAEEEVHKFFSLRGYVSVAEFQAFLHLDPDQWTTLCGWDDNIGLKRGYLWVEFGHERKIAADGRVYYTINYLIPPIFDEEFEWIMQDEDEWVMDEGEDLWVRS